MHGRECCSALIEALDIADEYRRSDLGTDGNYAGGTSEEPSYTQRHPVRQSGSQPVTQSASHTVTTLNMTYQ